MDNIVLTEKGLALRDKLNAGQTTATFTRFCTSSAEYDQSELGVLTELKDSKLESTVTNLEIREDHTMVISGAVDNKSLQEGYYITLIGLYAKETDGEEILFAVSKVSSPMYMPEKSGALSGMSIRFSVKIENSDSINVTVDPTTAATLGDLNALRSEVTTPTFEDYESEESPTLPALEDAMRQIKSGNTMRVILQNIKAVFKGLLNLVNAKVNQKDYDAAVSKLNGDITTLSGKLIKTVGAANRPVYFKDGVPSQCSCTVDKSVPSNAVFTDRTASIITKKFYKGKVTIGDHGTTDIPLATPSGYTYAGILDAWPIGTVASLYLDRDGSTSSKAKVWSPNSGSVTFSNIGVEVQYYKNS